MFRSLIGLLLLANLNTTGVVIPLPEATPVFQNEELLDAFPIPNKSTDDIAPVVDGTAALVMDLDSGLVLYEKNADAALPMASLTKIMTAAIILDNHNLSEIVTVQGDFSQELGVRIWLYLNEKITVGNLLMALLIPSGGDAAVALANFHSGSEEAFVTEMNRKATDLHLTKTHFMNPIGLDEEGHFSSARDLAILTKYALRFPAFRNIVGTNEATVTSTDGSKQHVLESTNALLTSYLDVRGVKTGTTDAAGQSLITLARNSGGHEIITVLLDSPSRFQEGKSIIDWVFRTFQW